MLLAWSGSGLKISTIGSLDQYPQDIQKATFTVHSSLNSVSHSSHSPSPPPLSTFHKMSPPKVAIIIYSLYGNISQSEMILIFPFSHVAHKVVVAEAVKAGIVGAGGNAQIFQRVKDSSRTLNVQLIVFAGFQKHSLRNTSHR